MDNLENQPKPASQSSALQEQCDSLRQLVSALLLVLLLVSGTLTIFLARQWRFTKNEIDLLSPQANQILTEFNRNLPMMQDFIKRLNDYGKTHPDFAPIVTKYHEVLGKPSTGPATTGGSMPSATH